MWNDVLQRGFEISSMGIRVDEISMRYQLKKRGCEERSKLPFHKMLLEGQLPLTIGGGIGQSRLCMLMIGTCPYRRGSSQPVGQGHCGRLRKGRRTAAVIVFLRWKKSNMGMYPCCSFLIIIERAPDDP